jgi:hypothetical protein
MFGLDSVFGTLTQGAGGGTNTAEPVSSGISGATSFSTGGLTVNKTDNTQLIIFGVIAAVVLFVVSRKK